MLPVPTYREVHRWLVKWRGSAKAQICAYCGNQARDWCFDNAEPSWPSPGGPYYPNPERYIPLCRPCHEMRDQGPTCKNGHYWADGNRYRRKTGGTICRACRRENMRKYAARKKKGGTDGL